MDLRAITIKGYFAFPKASSITGTSPSDCLVSLPGHSLAGRILPLCREAVGVFSSLGKYIQWIFEWEPTGIFLLPIFRKFIRILIILQGKISKMEYLDFWDKFLISAFSSLTSLKTKHLKFSRFSDWFSVNVILRSARRSISFLDTCKVNAAEKSWKVRSLFLVWICRIKNSFFFYVLAYLFTFQSRLRVSNESRYLNNPLRK